MLTVVPHMIDNYVLTTGDRHSNQTLYAISSNSVIQLLLNPPPPLGVVRRKPNTKPHAKPEDKLMNNWKNGCAKFTNQSIGYYVAYSIP